MPENEGNQPRALVVDGCPEIQQWMDAFVTSAVRGADAWWPEPHEVPYSAVTVAAICKSVAENVTCNGEAWSVVKLGLPPITDQSGKVMLGNQTVQPDTGQGGVSDPNKGSAYHNALHAILGNFHS